MPSNYANNLINTLEFETQHIYPDNLPSTPLLSRNQRYTLD